MDPIDKQLSEILCKHGELSVQQLSKILQVSPSSVRRKLRALDDHPFIRRIRGGVALSNVIPYDSLLSGFPQTDRAVARTIVYQAAQLIEPGDVIGLSGGPLCTELALNLRFREDLTIVTNAVNIACELVGLPAIKVMVCGGMLDLGSFDLVGQLMARTLDGVFMHKFFIETDGITVEYGLTKRSEDEAMAALEFVKHADQIILLSDQSNFLRSNLSQVIPAEKISTIITTDMVPDEVLRGFSEIGVEIRIAPQTTELQNDKG